MHVFARNPVGPWLASLCALVAAGCSGSEGAPSKEELLELGRLEAAMTATQDTLEGYAAKCDEATGIHVPTFNCDDGVEIPQGTRFMHSALVDQNIGMVFDGSRAVISPTEYSITAYGSDYWGTSDRFHFTHYNGDTFGDGFLDMYVKDLVETHQYAKAGLMFRQDMTQGSPHVAVAVTPSGGVQFQKRYTQGGNATNETVTGLSTPIWLRLKRDGDTYAGYASEDRIEWTQIGSPVTLAFSGQPAGGVAVASHNPSQQTTATFKDLSWTDAQGFDQCDSPNVLNGECDPGSRFQVLAQTQDAMVVANCRKKGNELDDGKYGDIAVIQYNRANGATCFYQSPVVEALDGTNMTAPIQGEGEVWLTPTQTQSLGCTGCHDNGGFVRSPYLTRIFGEGYPELGSKFASWFGRFSHRTSRYVGLDYELDKSWAVFALKDSSDSGLNCDTCHHMGISNFSTTRPMGTAWLFGERATAGDQASKNPHGETSPIWMRPNSVEYDLGAHETAKNFQDCARAFVSGLTPGFENGNSPTDCSFMETGRAADPGLDPLASANIGITGGTYTAGDYEEHTITAGGADIQGTSDEFFFRYFFELPSHGTATVKVTQLDFTDPWAKAGLMIRNNLDPDSANVMMTMTAGNGAHFQYRSNAGGNTETHSQGGFGMDSWIRLTRTGNTFIGYVSTDQETWTQVGPPVTIHNFSQSSLMGLAVTSHNTSATTEAVFDHFTWTPGTENTLVLQDINGSDGSHEFSSGAYEPGVYGRGIHTMTNRGSDIWGTEDGFTYSFRGLEGDGEIIAQVTSLDDTDPWAKAGVMFRGSTHPSALNAAMLVTSQNGARFQARTAGFGSTSAVSAPGGAPQWVRLVREGDTFTGYVSSDGSSWGSPVSSQTINGFPQIALVGMAVTSHNTGATTTATFENYSSAITP